MFRFRFRFRFRVTGWVGVRVRFRVRVLSSICPYVLPSLSFPLSFFLSVVACSRTSVLSVVEYLWTTSHEFPWCTIASPHES